MELSSDAPSDQPMVKGKCWVALIGRFEFLIAQLVLFRGEAAMCFWCKGGRHRSYALLIFFLMWAMHVHDHHLVEALLQRRLEVMRPTVELKNEDRISPKKRAGLAGAVKFGDVVLDWSEYLNFRYPQHCL